MEMLIQVSNAINSTLDLNLVFTTIMKETLAVIEAADEGYLFLYDPEEDCLVAKSIFLESNDVLSVVRLKPGESMTGIAFSRKKLTLFPDRESVYQATLTMSDANLQNLRAAAPIFPYSAACAPIITNDECIGVITLDCFHPDKSFKPEDLQLLEAISHQAAVALEKANLYREKEDSILLLEEMNQQMKRQNELLNRSLEIHQHLAGLVLLGEGIPSLLNYIHKLMNKPVLLLDQMGELLAVPATLTETLEPELLEELQKHLPLLDSGKTRNAAIIFPIGAKPNFLGYLVLLSSDPPDEVDMAALEHACTVLSFELLKEQAVFETEQNLKGQFIEELFTGNISVTLIEQAKLLHIDTKRYFQVLTIKFENELPDQLDARSRLLLGRRNITQIATDCFLQKYPIGVIAARQDHLVVLLSYANGTSLKETQRYLKERCETFAARIETKAWGVRVAVGVGSVKQGIEEVYKSAEEAAKCLQFMKTYRTELSYLCYSDLGARRLLLQHSTEELTSYVLDILGPLLVNEKYKKREFLHTLTSFLDHNQKMKETAEALNIHLNTLIYRIKRIEEILGLSFGNREQFMDLALAIQIYQLLPEQVQDSLEQRKGEIIWQ